MGIVRTELLAAGLAMAIPAVGNAAPVTVDFESDAGFLNSSMTLTGATLSTVGGGNFYVDPSGLDGFGGQSLSSHSSSHVDPEGGIPEVNPANLSAFRIDFGPVAASKVSIQFNDDCFIDCDMDTGYLQAFDANGDLLEQIDALLDGTNASELSLKVGGISYVLFWSDGECTQNQLLLSADDCTESKLTNSVYWDNLSYDFVSEVPLPGTLGLLGIGLAGLGLLRRKPS